MQPDHPDSQTAIYHLARLSDCVFALAMAITFMGFELPETVQLLSKDLDHRIIQSMQVKALIEPIYALVSILVALVSPDLSDLVWLLIPVVSPVLHKALRQTSISDVIPVSTQLVE